MNFRPCIDIHNGKVKQIVGSSLVDTNNFASENFVSQKNADYYANLYKKDNLRGGHIIILNSSSSEYFESSQKQAILALQSYPNGLQIGGGITDKNAQFYIEKGASHVIVTSFVMSGGIINFKNLDKLISEIGKEKLVLDLSCRKKDGEYFIVTDRWQKFTDVKLNEKTLNELSSYCDEFLIHAVDVEGTGLGLDKELISVLSKCKNIPITYAGGISSFEDIETIRTIGNNKIDFTIGSALDIFGGNLSYEKIVDNCK